MKYRILVSIRLSSSRRRPESMERLHHLRAWTPASAGVTVRTFSIALCIPVFHNSAAIKTDSVVIPPVRVN